MKTLRSGLSLVGLFSFQIVRSASLGHRCAVKCSSGVSLNPLFYHSFAIKETSIRMAIWPFLFPYWAWLLGSKSFIDTVRNWAQDCKLISFHLNRFLAAFLSSYVISVYFSLQQESYLLFVLLYSVCGGFSAGLAVRNDFYIWSILFPSKFPSFITLEAYSLFLISSRYQD
jgi:hypothetical protein